MVTARFVFAPDLAFFLGRRAAEADIQLSFEQHQSLKHLLESLGVPHTEIGAVLVDGQPVGLDYHPQNGERLEIQAVPPGAPAEARFLLDNHLGRLAASLRMLGFDCLYRNDFSDEQLAEALVAEPRILLTRDRRLLMRKVVQLGYCPRSLEPHEQLVEVMRRFCLAGLARPFQRCLRCNTLLEPVEKAAVWEQLEPRTRIYYQEFARCPGCAQVYWKGSHHERMQALVQTLLGDDPHGQDIPAPVRTPR